MASPRGAEVAADGPPDYTGSRDATCRLQCLAWRYAEGIHTNPRLAARRRPDNGRLPISTGKSFRTAGAPLGSHVHSGR